ncbi:hypothetical protein EG835_15205, partial [bacterium]|nr:hypothetical protein [bacterium]
MAKSGKKKQNKGTAQPGPQGKVQKSTRPSQGGSAAVAAPDAMRPAQRIAWFSLLCLVFVTPIIISNWTWLGFRLPFTYDQFDIIKVYAQRV